MLLSFPVLASEDKRNAAMKTYIFPETEGLMAIVARDRFFLAVLRLRNVMRLHRINVLKASMKS
jgi:hypothetical protein